LLIAALLATGEVRAAQATPAPAAESPAQASEPPQSATAAPQSTPETTAQEAADQTPRRHLRTRGDPLEGINRKLFSFHQAVDRAFFRPIALAYKHVLPKPLRTAIRHVISNLTEPLVFMNDVLQLKPKRAARTFSRFAINTTAGVGGILDIAKTAKLPHRDNSLGDTLARYGVGPGPYLFVPFFGPTDVRDLLGGQAENIIYPLAIGFPFDRTDYQVSSGLTSGLDLRAESDADFKALLDGAADPYATLRSVFQQSRAAEISEIKGEKPKVGLDDPLTDPEAPIGATDNADAATTPAAPLPAESAAPATQGTPSVATPAPTDPAESDPAKTPPAAPEPKFIALHTL
jgi:phospholipid-binding lipoprotein MlaA